jgi:phosphoglycolate phosphatase-like HAD superfamily hydrolase
MSPSVCPSVGELLAALKGQNKLLGVVSGNLEAIGWLKLKAAGLRDFFDFGSFSGARELRVDIFRHGIAEASKRSRPAARVCFVGDTPDDVAAARQLGTPVIAVATGIYSVEQLTAAVPDICVGCCADLMSCLPGMSSAQS